jgi:hypothetical protein
MRNADEAPENDTDATAVHDEQQIVDEELLVDRATAAAATLGGGIEGAPLDPEQEQREGEGAR